MPPVRRAEAAICRVGFRTLFDCGTAELHRWPNCRRRVKLPPSFLFRTVAVDVLPSFAEKLFSYEYLAANDTEEKFEASLLKEPEPDVTQLETMLQEISQSLPRLGKRLAVNAKAFPHKRGGRPRMIGSLEAQRELRQEIKNLRGPGTRLEDLFKRMALKHGVSPSKIKQVWSSHELSAEGNVK